MTLLTRVQAGVTRAIAKCGTTCVVKAVAGVYDTSTGITTETETSYAAACTDLFDETQQMVGDGTSARAVGSIVINGNVAFTPAVGNRVELSGRRFEVIDVQPYRLTGGVGAYRLNLAELGAV